MTKNFEYYPEEGTDASSARMNTRAEQMIGEFQAKHFISRGHKALDIYQMK